MNSTLQTGIRVLQALGAEANDLGIAQLARQLGVGKSGIHRVLTTLHDSGLVLRTPARRYRLAAASRALLPAAARPIGASRSADAAWWHRPQA